MLGVFRSGLRLIDEALSLVFQTECHLCGRFAAASSLCDACDPIKPLSSIVCQRCGEPVPQRIARCGRCDSAPHEALTRARSLLWLTEEAQALVHRIKYRQSFELIDLFRPAIRYGFDTDFPPEAQAMAVPMHPAKLVSRSFNQAEILVDTLHRDLGIPRSRAGLVKLRNTGSQTKLGVAERARNLSGALAWRGTRPPPEQVLLVDDIYTTGATLEAAARALREAGTKEVFGWTLFRTPKLMGRATVPPKGPSPLC